MVETKSECKIQNSPINFLLVQVWTQECTFERQAWSSRIELDGMFEIGQLKVKKNAH